MHLKRWWCSLGIDLECHFSYKENLKTKIQFHVKLDEIYMKGLREDSAGKSAC